MAVYQENVSYFGAGDEAQAFLPIVQRAMPDFGGYGLVLGGEPGELRIEAYGDVPILFNTFSVAALAGAAATQVEKAGAGQPAWAEPGDDLDVFLDE